MKLARGQHNETMKAAADRDNAMMKSVLERHTNLQKSTNDRYKAEIERIKEENNAAAELAH